MQVEAVAAMQKKHNEWAWRQIHFEIRSYRGSFAFDKQASASGSGIVQCKQGANRSGFLITALIMAKCGGAAAADDLELTTNSEGEHVPRHLRRARARRATASGHGKK